MEGPTMPNSNSLQETTSGSGRVAWMAGAAALVIACGAAGVAYWLKHRDIESTDNAYVRADSTLVAPKVSGYIAVLQAEDNHPVKAGQLLAQIDDRDFTVALEQARADLKTHAAQVADTEAQTAAHAAMISQARAQVASANAALDLARSNQLRQKKMANIGFASTQHEEEASTELRLRTADADREQAALRNAQGQTQVLQAKVDVARAQLEGAQAAVRRAELELAYTKIVAPIDGIIAARTVRMGQYVQSGTQLMALVPIQAVYVVANFKETQLGQVRGGERATIRVDTFSNVELSGTVDSLAPASGLEFSLLPPDNATGNFTKIVQRIPVKIRIDPNQPLAGQLRPGMSVEASIQTSREPKPVITTAVAALAR
ncbi:MAG: hemolysin [Herbaspirillum sp.]|nr:hemolysin [Herbaspirillum sp.]